MFPLRDNNVPELFAVFRSLFLESPQSAERPSSPRNADCRLVPERIEGGIRKRWSWPNSTIHVYSWACKRGQWHRAKALCQRSNDCAKVLERRKGVRSGNAC